MNRADWPKHVDAVVFDLDGTLIDSAHDISFCVNETLTRLKRPAIDEEIIWSFVGRGVLPLIERSLDETAARSDTPDDEAGPVKEQAIALFKDLYEAHCLDQTRLYPGIMEVLDTYAGKALAVVTNKAERFTFKILEGLGVRDRFKTVLGGDSMTEKKPHPGPVLRALDEAGVRPREAVFVGDSAIDVKAGKAADTWTCGVLYGLRPESEIREAGPDTVVFTATEILKRFV